MTHLVYDEAIEFFKDRHKFPGGSDAIENLQQAIMQSGKQFGKAMENFGKSLHGVASAMDFNPIRVMSPDEIRRQRSREMFYKYRAACLHGERHFYIRWSDEAKVSMGVPL